MGNTARQSAEPLGQAVHPHACGEHASEASASSPSPGSSPRLWGTRIKTIIIITIIRFIPTPVGNTPWSMPKDGQAAVHPHACGEHTYEALFRGLGYGSSPRLWGTHPLRIPSIDIERFIPTPVGNTSRAALLASPISVHPHACGEHFFLILLLRLNIGSSPRLWGTLLKPDVQEFDNRFIPTPVGNTLVHTDRLFLSTVHPHACGEHHRLACALFLFRGSSPRLWGTRIRAAGQLATGRFIPTPVGNTRAPLKEG